MSTPEEKTAFAERLELALRRRHGRVPGATELANRFNLRYPGEPVSAQTAHKWLTGRTIPTRDKLGIIADWLGVDLHWLHYGPPPVAHMPVASARDWTYPLAAETIELAVRIGALSPQRRYLIRQLIDQFPDEAPTDPDLPSEPDPSR
jgi:transcriptional regulator with XRE-family HTH domain